jgi:hypothetical protein
LKCPGRGGIRLLALMVGKISSHFAAQNVLLYPNADSQTSIGLRCATKS